MAFYPKTDSQSTSIIISLLAGLGAGIIVGLMIAPKAGQQLREAGTESRGEKVTGKGHNSGRSE